MTIWFNWWSKLKYTTKRFYTTLYFGITRDVKSLSNNEIKYIYQKEGINTLYLLRFINRLCGKKISNYYFNTWLKTKEYKYLNIYLDLTYKF